MPVTHVLDSKLLIHERFCLPRPDEEAPRIEGFVAYVDGPNGFSVPHTFVTRCLECGATHHRPIT